jgi:hypothetical protein
MNVMDMAFRYFLELTIACCIVAFILFLIHVIADYRARRRLMKLHTANTEQEMQSFMELAIHDQPIIELAQHAFRALAGELIFIDARLQKTISTDIPVYDLKYWNTATAKDLPRTVDVGPKGIAVKFEHPGIWYEIVFSSRRGYGTLAVRRYMLAAVANRVEELIITQQRLHNYRTRA